ncbi:hypothetical protein L226DRAFT_379809 [Lentinus tigrinus ALCF2SS1-7]|uniref:Uncharacterized protein n=1 Tax=Lentinus tigrinus ALCF2SS1-6 TaxID=1328759 RepID=A0A5C2SKT5_9APHY|nr:hypothetical protein L227DRAFT_584089 [Lentinus tigrinus ALCF2SS1-6]RPD76551.1 hypothetical protein L226DRAFT_379809 [Lentinus tigrinus ALCF2SS1-7]
MPGLAILSPINESEELSSSSPYRARFGYGRYPGQRSPMGPRSPRSPYHNAHDTGAGPSNAESMDDLWIYDCYVSEDATSPGGYPRSPSTPSHNRSISLPVSTANFIPPNNTPLIKEPTPHRPPPLDVPSLPSGSPDTIMEITENVGVIDSDEASLGLPSINTAVYTAVEFPEYSPLEQEVYTMREVIDQLAAAVDQFSGLESVLSRTSAVDPAPEMDEDTVFWFIEALNLFVSDCTEVALDLMQFSEFVEALLMGEKERSSLPVRTLPRASFNEREMQEVLGSAATIQEFEIVEAMAELEAAVPPSPVGQRPIRERPPSLKLSTSDAVLLQTQLQPRSRMQSVGAVGRFTERQTSKGSPPSSVRERDEATKKHRAYVIYGDVEATPIEDNWSAKSIVEFSFGEEGGQAQTDGVARPRPMSGQSAIPRPLSSPVAFGGKSLTRGRPPSLTLDSPRSPSSHSTSSSVSSLFSALPRSSFTTSSSPRSSPRQSITFDKGDKSRFPTSSVKFKKMFTNIFKNKDGASRTAAIPSSLRPFGRRTAGTGSIDATLSALHLSGMSAESPLAPEQDPFAASPPPSASLPIQMPPDSTSEPPALLGYSSMFVGLKAASQYPAQPLFGGVGRELESP